MSKLFITIFLLLSATITFGQYPTQADLNTLQQNEDSLKVLSRKIIEGETSSIRFINDSLFTRLFVKSLKIPYSFEYTFDSLETISKLYAPDSSFKVFTWQMVVSQNLVRQHGAIQMRTPDGTLKLFPLIDKSDVIQNAADTTANNRSWQGAVYYKLIQNRSSNQNFYTLLGYDENDLWSKKKVIEVLTFINDEPLFGGRHFSYEEDTVFKSSISRFIMEYKKTATARLTYDENLEMIIYDHLISEIGDPKKKFTYIPDGDYEGFKWKNGKWVHIEKVFNQITELGKEPVPAPVKDAQGNTIEEKLKDNYPKEEEEAPEKPKKKKSR